jgi:hypothetical protein
VLYWGEEYRDFHRKAWIESLRVLQPGGRFILNISDHIMDGEQQFVSAWHVTTLIELGLELKAWVPVGTARMKFGENAERRVPWEWVIRFDK